MEYDYYELLIVKTDGAKITTEGEGYVELSENMCRVNTIPQLIAALQRMCYEKDLSEADKAFFAQLSTIETLSELSEAEFSTYYYTDEEDDDFVYDEAMGLYVEKTTHKYSFQENRYLQM